MAYPEFCFYVPGATNLIDTARAKDGTYVGHFSGETVDQMAHRHPGVQLMEFEAACNAVDAAIRGAYVQAPVEITEERFNEMRDVLPPLNWRRSTNCESFKMAEMTAGHFTSIFARVGFHFFELTDCVSTPHETIIQKCRATYEAQS